MDRAKSRIGNRKDHHANVVAMDKTLNIPAQDAGVKQGKRNLVQRWFALCLIVILVCQSGGATVEAADRQYRVNVNVSVDGVDRGVFPALDDNYENNLYLSLKGLAYALSGSAKAFRPIVEKRKIDIETGVNYSARPSAWEQKSLNTSGSSDSAPYEMHVDESARRYHSFILQRDGDYDAFLTPVSLAMLFDLNIKVLDGKIEIDTTTPFSVSAKEMEESGYLQGVNALVIGDGSTGEIWYHHDKDEVLPIASTTKLMTYFVLMDAVERGECSLEDTVVISERASRLSNGSDGVIPMRTGTRFPLREALYGMLLPSSNECALAIAEHVAGSQEAFVERMNAKAKELGLANTEYYNCHGLPAFEDQLIPAKLQNHMTAEEMFRLASALVDTYPQITEFTSTQKYHMPSFDRDVNNTNAIIYNMENAVGLKTGTTNKAGACLVSCVAAEKNGGTHYLLVVLLGAEGDANRGTVSEIAARYAVRTLQEDQSGQQEPLGEEERVIPVNPELVIKKLIQIRGKRP